MKTLKSMLAVATAVGLATAVQAVQDKDVSTGFEKLQVGANIGTGVPDTQNDDGTFPSGVNSYFKYAGANADDNESAIVEFTEADVAATAGKRPTGVSKFTGLDSTARSKALQISTGADPLLRTFAEQSSTSFQSIETTMYVDTLVQFTVTPDDDTVTPSADDKLMIYLKETKTVKDDETVSYTTNLVVKAGIIDGDDDGNFWVETNEYTLVCKVVEPYKWYRLTVEMIPNVFSSENWEEPCMGFSIKIDGEDCTTGGSFWTAGAEATITDVLSEFGQTAYGRLVIPIKGFGALGLQGVGFAGEGKVDDFVYTSTDPAATVVNFTFAFDATKVDAVNYTVGGAEQTENYVFEDVEVGSVVEIKTLAFMAGYEFDKYTLSAGVTQATTTEGSVATFKINDDATGNVSLTIVAKEKAATYPTYVKDADDTVKGNYNTWLEDTSGIVAGGDASTYEKQFLLNQAASKAIADNALVIKSITENANGGWDIVIGCSVSGVGLSTPDAENAQVCNGYLAVSYTSDLSGTWTKENINVEAGTETGTVKVNVNKSGAKFMKVSLETTKVPATAQE